MATHHHEAGSSRSAYLVKMQRSLALVLIAGIMVFALEQRSPATAEAATPIPGGANQLKGISGGLAATLFNGKVRIRKMALRAATPAEYTPDSGKTGLMFSFLVSNGTNKERSGQFSGAIVDADAVSIDGGPLHVYDAYYSLQPGAAAPGRPGVSHQSQSRRSPGITDPRGKLS